jgi:hypothetical protein
MSSNQSGYSLWNRTGAGVTIGPLLIFGVWLSTLLWTEFCYFSEASLWQQRQLWPTTNGEILSAIQDKTNYSKVFRINFSYIVDGKKYSCQQSDFKDKNYLGTGADANGNFTVFDEHEIKKLSTDFNTNKNPTIHYDPANPSISFVDVNYSAYTDKMWSTHIAVLFCAAAIFIYLFLSFRGDSKPN